MGDNTLVQASLDFRMGGGLSRLDELFAALDANGDGTMDAQEVTAMCMMASSCPTTRHLLTKLGDDKDCVDVVQQYMKSCDKDGDQKISLEELIAFFAEKGATQEEIDALINEAKSCTADMLMIQVLASLDEDKNGMLDKAELAQLFVAIIQNVEDPGFESFEAFMASQDKNGDGFVDKREFAAWLKDSGMSPTQMNKLAADVKEFKEKMSERQAAMDKELSELSEAEKAER